MQPVYVTNRLSFLSNARNILTFIRARNDQGQVPPQFSLQAIRPMPAALQLPLTKDVLRLVLMNSALPPLEATRRQVALDNLFYGQSQKASPAAVRQAIEETRAVLSQQAAAKGDSPLSPEARQTALAVFKQAVANYAACQCFSYYDWRLTHWGTLADIQAVTPATFEQPTTWIEFQTQWTPPIAALRYLAQTFPSVRFELRYRGNSADSWTEVEILPLTPFGY